MNDSYDNAAADKQILQDLQNQQDKELANDVRATIKYIRQQLRARSGKDWSVTNQRGTAWGWIHIAAPPRRLGEFGQMKPEDSEELGRLLDLNPRQLNQWASIPSSGDYRREFIARARGDKPAIYGQQYWD